VAEFASGRTPADIVAGQGMARGRVTAPCKTVGSAYVGSNPTPATQQNPRPEVLSALLAFRYGALSRF